MADEVLDNPVWHALSGPHANFAIRRGQLLRYAPEMAPFAAMVAPTADAIAELPGLISPGGAVAIVATKPVLAPAGTEAVLEAEVQQMEARALRPAVTAVEFVNLTVSDVPAMLALVELTQPGPFGRRTIEMGRYIGVRKAGVLVAMTGERMRLAGHTEISAVCVHPDHRGRGYAKALVSAIAAGIVANGATPFLHVYPDNRPAIAAYEALGFTARRMLHFTVLKRAGDSA